MAVICQNPARPAHEIVDGGRKVTLTAILVWGSSDVRGDWTGDYVFCSFGCCSEWAATRAQDHDGVVLRDGDAEQLTPDQIALLAPAPTAVPVDVQPAPVAANPPATG